jgi:hypothetical protein
MSSQTRFRCYECPYILDRRALVYKQLLQSFSYYLPLFFLPQWTFIYSLEYWTSASFCTTSLLYHSFCISGILLLSTELTVELIFPPVSTFTVRVIILKQIDAWPYSFLLKNPSMASIVLRIKPKPLTWPFSSVWYGLSHNMVISSYAPFLSMCFANS